MKIYSPPTVLILGNYLGNYLRCFIIYTLKSLLTELNECTLFQTFQKILNDH